MEQGAGQRLVQAARLVGFDELIIFSMNDPDGTPDVLILKLLFAVRTPETN
jgi:hypothetical protein